MSRTKDLVLISILSATLTAAKMILSFIPNVEIVTFLLIIYTIHFGLKRSLIVSVIFVSTDILISGFGFWVPLYVVVWPLLTIVTHLVRTVCKNEYHYAVLAGLFGFTFGMIDSIIHYFLYDASLGIIYYIKGFPFDVIHMVSNFIVMLILYNPINNSLSKIITLKK